MTLIVERQALYDRVCRKLRVNPKPLHPAPPYSVLFPRPHEVVLRELLPVAVDHLGSDEVPLTL